MAKENVRTIEINGVKFDVDLRTLKRVDEFKVGDSVKVLVKTYNGYESYIGVIIGFDDFKDHPSLTLAYLNLGYASAEIIIKNYNSDTKDIEIAPLNQYDMPFTYAHAIEMFQRDITRKENELNEAYKKKKVFENLFGKYFGKAEEINPDLVREAKTAIDS